MRVRVCVCVIFPSAWDKTRWSLLSFCRGAGGSAQRRPPTPCKRICSYPPWASARAAGGYINIPFHFHLHCTPLFSSHLACHSLGAEPYPNGSLVSACHSWFLACGRNKIYRRLMSCSYVFPSSCPARQPPVVPRLEKQDRPPVVQRPHHPCFLLFSCSCRNPTLCVCVFACVCVCVCACVRTYVRRYVRARTGVRACLRACVRACVRACMRAFVYHSSP